jgi:transposase
MRAQYAQYLEQGKVENPLQAENGKRGKTKQTKARNLLDRLELFAGDVWRFAVEPNVDFTNNLAEQAVRMPKVKQKISGCFRTDEGARCSVPCDYIPRRSWPLFEARAMLQSVIASFKSELQP